MSRRTVLAFGAGFALVAAGVTILLAGYFERAAMLPMQVALIAGPSFAPFLIAQGVRRRGAVAALCLPMVVGWGATISTDRQPRLDASFAVFLGWYGCAAAILLAVLLAILSLRRR